MVNHKNFKRNKNLIRSALTGRIINGKECILTEEAPEYLKKMGYIVKNPYNENVIDALDYFMVTTIKQLGKKNEQQIQN